jgi:flagellar basal-body rod protein FlgB
MKGKKMALEYSKAHALMTEALSARNLRQDLIAGNIANIDTPFYRSRDINFEDALKDERAKIFGNDNSKELKLAQTNASHLDPYVENDPSKSTLFFRDGHMARNDGNTVDLDIETTELGKNSTVASALIYAIKKDAMIYKSVLEASSKV